MWISEGALTDLRDIRSSKLVTSHWDSLSSYSLQWSWGSLKMSELNRWSCQFPQFTQKEIDGREVKWLLLDTCSFLSLGDLDQVRGWGWNPSFLPPWFHHYHKYQITIIRTYICLLGTGLLYVLLWAPHVYQLNLSPEQFIILLILQLR